MSELSIVFAALAVASVAYWYWRRGRGAGDSVQRGYLLRYSDIDGWRVLPAHLDAAGLVADGVTYPVPVRVVIGGFNVWVLLVDSAALVDHVALERARESAALHSLWAGGGQWLDFLRVAGVVLPVVFSILVWQQVSALAAMLAAIASQIELLR